VVPRERKRKQGSVPSHQEVEKRQLQRKKKLRNGEQVSRRRVSSAGSLSVSKDCSLKEGILSRKGYKFKEVISRGRIGHRTKKNEESALMQGPIKAMNRLGKKKRSPDIKGTNGTHP